MRTATRTASPLAATMAEGLFVNVSCVSALNHCMILRNRCGHAALNTNEHLLFAPSLAAIGRAKSAPTDDLPNGQILK
jgi:hypothetical protein